MAGLHVLISGSSVAGPTLGYFLAHAGAHVTIVERSPILRLTGQGVDIRGAGRDVVRRMGPFDAIREKTTQEKGLMFVNERNAIVGQFVADMSNGQSITSDLEILRGDLAGLLYEAASMLENVKYIFGDSVASVQQQGDKVNVTFNNGATADEYDLVIAADGMGSRLRDMAFGLEPGARVRSLDAYVGYFSIPPGETDTEWSRCYNTNKGRTILVRPDNAGATRAFLCATGNRPEMYQALTEDVPSQKAVFDDVFHDAGWEVRRILDGLHESDDFYMQELAQVKLDKWSAGRVTVVGDAGYAPSGVTGMGTSLAFVGAYVLAGEVSRRPDDVPAALEAYEATFRPYAERAQKLAPGVPWIVNPQTSLGVSALRAAVGVASFLSSTGIPGLLAKLISIPSLTDDPFKLPDYETFR